MRGLRGIFIALLAGLGLLASAPSANAGGISAGVGVVDSPWHVGASAGQYASTKAESQDLDPHMHQMKNAPSYGVQSRPQMRAVVVEGLQNPLAPGGSNRFALVKTDMYIPQDLLYRRAAQLIEEIGGPGVGIDRTNLVMSTTHDHSSPYYTSTAWGAWSFQDVFDIRAYEYYARKIAEAVVEAAGKMRPVKVAGHTSTLSTVHRHSMGPDIADDGTPAGYPSRWTDHDLHVVRLDDADGPYALIVNYSNHPEGLDGNDLISGDWVSAMERMLDRDTGATTIYTQNAVGGAEMERSSHRPPSERHEYYHREYGQGEHAARLTANAALEAFEKAATGDAQVPFFDQAVVDFRDAWFPGPLTHPYPAVSSCRTDQIPAGNPRVPVVGLPDCTGPQEQFGQSIPFSQLPIIGNGPGLVWETLRDAGIPVPENYGAPSFTGLEEDVSVHLQGFRIGDIFFPVCSCEQWADQSLNLKARTDKVARNDTEGDNLGYDWSERCEPAGDGTWSCVNPRNESQRLTIPDLRYRRMKAQVNNDAFGWNSVEWAPWAESEPGDPDLIKGNFTHDDNATSAELGYGMTVPISMANDYNGYIVSYREFQQGDHYRKALAGWGPHSSDYMTTRLVKLGRLMNGGPGLDETIRDAEGNDVGREGVADPDADHPALQLKTDADVLQNDGRAKALGAGAQAAIAAYEATLPDDGGEARITRQPESVERFDLAAMQWNGGSNYTDDPVVKVQRLVDGGWTNFADGSGEVVTTLRFPTTEELPAYRATDQEWIWTAHWETFVSRVDTGGGQLATPAGTYRFVVDGQRREGRRTVGYRLESQEFSVRPWSGITADDVRRESDGRVSFKVGPRRSNVTHYDFGGGNSRTINTELGPIDYPDSYASRRADVKARFIDEKRNYTGDPASPFGFQLYCVHCAFRPWLDLGDAETATVTVGDGHATREVEAVRDGDRWITTEPIADGESAQVCAGGVRDAYGNHNGAPSQAVGEQVCG